MSLRASCTRPPLTFKLSLRAHNNSARSPICGYYGDVIHFATPTCLGNRKSKALCTKRGIPRDWRGLQIYIHKINTVRLTRRTKSESNSQRTMGEVFMMLRYPAVVGPLSEEDLDCLFTEIRRVGVKIAISNYIYIVKCITKLFVHRTNICWT